MTKEMIDAIEYLRTAEGVEWSENTYRPIGLGLRSDPRNPGNYYGRGVFGEIKEDVKLYPSEAFNYHPAKVIPDCPFSSIPPECV